MSWDRDTAQTQIRLRTRKSSDAHSREESPVSCIVRKCGGACFADRDDLLRVARQVLAAAELPAVIVVSARQGVTDQLSGQADDLGRDGGVVARDRGQCVDRDRVSGRHRQAGIDGGAELMRLAAEQCCVGRLR